MKFTNSSTNNIVIASEKIPFLAEIECEDRYYREVTIGCVGVSGLSVCIDDWNEFVELIKLIDDELRK